MVGGLPMIRRSIVGRQRHYGMARVHGDLAEATGDTSQKIAPALELLTHYRTLPTAGWAPLQHWRFQV